MRKLLILSILILPLLSGYSQSIISGRVYDLENKKPIEFASVYISNSTKATITDKNGQFKISNSLPGRSELVISCVGYETYVQELFNKTYELEVFLKPKITELQEVILESSNKNGWKKWGRFFLEQFIGTTEFSTSCKITNTDALQFSFNKKSNTLKVTSKESLLIRNNSFGYSIKYDLSRFAYDFNTRSLTIEGHPLFEEMTSNKKRQEIKWRKNREEAYYGSMMHFMRSLYNNELEKDHFEIRRIVKLSNQMNGLVNKIIPRDSIVFKSDSSYSILNFKDKMQVIYTLKEPSAFYNKGSINIGFMRTPQTSQLSLIESAIKIFENGSYFDGTNLIVTGYWAWSEKVSNLLPLDYFPDTK